MNVCRHAQNGSEKVADELGTFAIKIKKNNTRKITFYLGKFKPGSALLEATICDCWSPHLSTRAWNKGEDKKEIGYR